MRLRVFLALVALPLHAAETDDETKTVPVNEMAAPVAEPIDGGYYAPQTNALDESPSPSDIGPVQKHFVLASNVDTDTEAANPHNPNNPPSEPFALDSRIRVPLVHDVQNDSSFRTGNNDSLLYELKYLNWGAVTQEQLQARQGHYFTITVKNAGPPEDLTMRFEYRQEKSKQVVRTLMQDQAHVRGAVRAYFAVVNHAYVAYGPITAWRFSVLRGGTVVAQVRSFLW